MNLTSSNQELTLDLTTLVQLSQAIAAEIVLSRLLPALIQIFMENTGAHIGFLVMDKAGEWVIEAAGELHSTEIRTTSLLQSIPIVHHLPHSIINYVGVKQTSVNLNHATQTGEFTTDPYIQAHQSQSILCVPLVYDRQLKGIVYLENQQSGHFSAYHLALIEILSGQAAIAITNAQVYTQVKERESQLAQLLDGLPVGVAMHDTTGKMIYANSVAMQIAGDESVREATSEEISQAYKLYRAGTQAPYPTSQLPVVRALAGETLTIDDMELYQGDRVISLEVVSTPIYNEQGQIVYALCAVQDITQRKQAEVALKRSEASLRFAQRVARLGSWEFDVLSRKITWSEELFRIFGLDPTQPEPTYEEMLQLVHPDDRALMIDMTERMIQTGISVDFDYRIIHPDQTIRFVEGRGETICNSQGQVIKLIGSGLDVTERKLAEVALRQSQEIAQQQLTEIEAIYATTPIGMCVVDTNLRYVRINERLAEINGLPVKAQIGRRIREVLPELADELEPIYLQVIKSGLPVLDVETHGTTPAQPGVEKDWLSSYYPLKGSDGQVVGVNVTVQDITERKQAEIALKESEERFRQLAENIDAVLWIAAKGHFQIIYVSHAYTRIWGRNVQDVYDNPHSFFDAIYPEDLEKVRSIVPVTNPHYDVEYRIVRPDGEIRWLRDRSFPIRNAQGEIYRYGGIAEDITEKKQIEAQFLRAQRLESVGTLASGIAHNLNNILSPILLSLELLERKLPDQKSQQLLKMLESNVKRGSALVKQVLSFSRGVSGKHTIINIKHIVSEIQYIIQETFPKSIKLSTNLAPDLWNICADGNQLHQVLMNLCINARDAMPHGGSLSIYATNLFIDETSARRYLDAQVGEYVMVSVADTGSGIAPEILERIFEPFFTTKEVGQGTGLGLSTVMGIIKHHGGFVNVESTLGKGSQFQVYLPAVTDGQQQPVREIELPKGQGELILLVDDEKSIRETAKVLLSNYNYKVLTANNGIEAIALYVEHKAEISLVFIDMTMPDMDGLTTIRTLHRINPHLKVIASSGLPSNETIAEFSSLGVKAFLSKPYTLNELLKTFSLVLTGTV
ncbi:hybrid sensor histidine kinase/response regulator [Nostoc sp. PCC 7524]|uniref:hybrid sensor histidine kinase/response regulator n=1 Tax=Nostoc sp. (strain ATCC 29411 / PCC 7524) TaxID=28072 RepID=UPI001494F383|nr:PAS domain S-box protein [Nostoc sp. PCC 7524]